ncbi:MAG: YnbE family lipoprotein [Deltaproteobacteria bacterium]|nr:YnbE family lipoprotein [Deltaproteobacteria bacterium]
MKRLAIGVVLLGVVMAGCSTRHAVEVAPVEVKPIHITIDVNVRVQKDLDSFFGDIDEAQQELKEKQ